MKFTCLQENLSKGLSIVCRAVPTKSALPLLSNVLISAENGRLKLLATNLETAILTYIGASVDHEGSITVPAKLLKEFISNLSPSTINVHLDQDILHLSSNKTKSRFNGVSPADFPAFPEKSAKSNHIEIDSKLLNLITNHVAFAAAGDDSRPVFSGVYLTFNDGVLTVAAADGYRLSEKTVKLDKANSVANFSAIIPAKTLIEVARIFSNLEEPIKFMLNENENRAIFEAEDTRIATLIISGEYPNYKRIIPTETSVTAQFLADELLEAVRLTSVFSKDAGSAVRIKVNSEGFMEIISAAQETGEHQSQIPAQVEGSNMEVAFNSKYLLDLLNNVKSEHMVLNINTAASPCLFKPLDHEDYFHIIAPMQIQG